MLKSLNEFIRAEDGAVTVDWVVLCAAVVGLAIGMVTAIQTGVFDITAAIDGIMSGWTF